MLSWIKEKAYWLTFHQWEEIDKEYKKEEFDSKIIITFIAIISVLILQRYFGKSNFITTQKWALDFFSTLPHSDIYPKLYWAFFNVINYFFIPFLVIKFVYKESILDYGFHLEKKKSIFLLYLGMFLIVLPLVYIVSHSPAFLNKYPFYKRAADSYFQFFLWEGSYSAQFFMLEFFYRGFILFVLVRYVGSIAVFIMMVPYVMIHFSKPLPETVGAIITGITLGTLALRTKSIYGGVIIHVSVALSMDILSLYQKGLLSQLF